MKKDINREGIIKDLELFYFIKKEVISIGERYYLLGVWTMGKFFSRPKIEKLIKRDVLKRIGLYKKQPREIRQMFINGRRLHCLSASRSTILWEVDYQGLVSLIKERESALLGD